MYSIVIHALIISAKNHMDLARPTYEYGFLEWLGRSDKAPLKNLWCDMLNNDRVNNDFFLQYAHIISQADCLVEVWHTDHALCRAKLT